MTSRTSDAVDDEVRPYADGLTSWTVGTAAGVDQLVVFDRPAGFERDVVVLAAATGAMVVQRNPGGEVRLVGSFGVARRDGRGRHVEPPVDSWLARASRGIPDSDALDRPLRVAVHDRHRPPFATCLTAAGWLTSRRGARPQEGVPPLRTSRRPTRRRSQR